MALQVTKLIRVFTIKKDGKDVQLSDPDANLTPEQVMKHYIPIYPELTNAVVEGPKVAANKANYSITTKAGKLG